MKATVFSKCQVIMLPVVELCLCAPSNDVDLLNWAWLAGG